jgi:hypothetical protein
MRSWFPLGVAVCLSAAAVVYAASKDLGQGFRDHGVATPISCHRGTVATVDGQGHPVVLSWLMDHRGGYALLLVDAQTGTANEYPIPFPLGDSPFASLLSSGNKFYSHFGSHFLEFDPAQRAFTFWRKSAPQMAMSMTEDDQGVIWSASYPQSGVVSFHPKTREFQDFGHVYRQDWAQYPRSVAADDSGWVYLGVGSTACQILAFDPKTGKAMPMVPEDQRQHGTGYVLRGTDGKVYGQPNSSQPDHWHVFYGGRATRVGKRPLVAAKPIIAGSQGLFHDVFPDGKRIKTLDLPERLLVVEDPKTKSQKTVRFEYRSEGAHVMGVAAAPDGTICGGTAFPMRFFRYDPRKDQWANREAFGQWNTVARQGDRFLAGTYGGGCLLEWNPLAPWVNTVPGRKDSNPLFLTECAPTINRPHKLLAHPDGHTVVLAGTPGYGHTGGGLLFWDRKTQQKVLLTHRDLIPEHSTTSLVALDGGKLLGGTSTRTPVATRIVTRSSSRSRPKPATVHGTRCSAARWARIAAPGKPGESRSGISRPALRATRRRWARLAVRPARRGFQRRLLVSGGRFGKCTRRGCRGQTPGPADPLHRRVHPTPQRTLGPDDRRVRGGCWDKNSEIMPHLTLRAGFSRLCPGQGDRALLEPSHFRLAVDGDRAANPIPFDLADLELGGLPEFSDDDDAQHELCAILGHDNGIPRFECR